MAPAIPLRTIGSRSIENLLRGMANRTLLESSRQGCPMTKNVTRLCPGAVHLLLVAEADISPISQHESEIYKVSHPECVDIPAGISPFAGTARDDIGLV